MLNYQRVLIAQQRSMFLLIFGREASLSMVRGWAKSKRMLDRYHESKPLSGFSHLQTDELWSLNVIDPMKWDNYAGWWYTL